mmetsp:Transcript_98090/g.302449  ORF Transcript_98090/g.302449 Transcript_98090/m.302449 type:complete len:257 (-) Transcript_98090:432-1202(-)
MPWRMPLPVWPGHPLPSPTQRSGGGAAAAARTQHRASPCSDGPRAVQSTTRCWRCCARGTTPPSSTSGGPSARPRTQMRRGRSQAAGIPPQRSAGKRERTPGRARGGGPGRRPPRQAGQPPRRRPAAAPRAATPPGAPPLHAAPTSCPACARGCRSPARAPPSSARAPRRPRPSWPGSPRSSGGAAPRRPRRRGLWQTCTLRSLRGTRRTGILLSSPLPGRHPVPSHARARQQGHVARRKGRRKRGGDGRHATLTV